MFHLYLQEPVHEDGRVRHVQIEADLIEDDLLQNDDLVLGEGVVRKETQGFYL